MENLSECELSSATDDSGHDPDFAASSDNNETSEEELEISFNEASEDLTNIHKYCKRMITFDVEKITANDKDCVHEYGDEEVSIVEAVFVEMSNAEQAALVEAGGKDGDVDGVGCGDVEEAGYVDIGDNANRPDCNCDSIGDVGPVVQGGEKEIQEKKRHIETDHTLRLRKSEKARKRMSDDKEAAKVNAACYICSNDMQKASYVHDLAVNTGYFYVWDETVASRGAQVVTSHFELNARDKKNVIIYSDTYTGQNRYIKMALSLMQFVQRTDTQIERIDQKYLVSGLSFLPNNSDLASMELAAKGKTINVVENRYDIMASCRQKKKFIVCQMQADEVYSTKPLEMYITRTKIIKIRVITKMKRKNMIDLLPFIPQVYYTFLNLNTTEVDAERDMPDLE
ncbi:hypothetical protein PR048_020949 [Dryococelus australis]|uniref:Uncharacterized protein n=1 Tax=Dryococelus australis TaxID=614101 RepID=A0ABQ9GWX5_9NEOP|nr:hypothetical protein PR048_020949 [Dryococelus australis]